MLTYKWLGSALVIFACSAAGFQVAARYGRRPPELAALQTGLALLVTEVEYGATPLPEALRRSGSAAGARVGLLFAETADRLEAGGGITAGEAFAAALGSGMAQTHLQPEDRSILEALAPVLGASGRADQVRHLRLALERLAAAEARARDERQRYERMARYLGVLSGAALVLILL